MTNRYDVVVLGTGEAGIFAAYELALRCPEAKVRVVDQGADIYHRSCPIVAGKVKACINCKVCDTMCGFGGAGAFSDGKFNFTTDFGGWLTDFLSQEEVMELIDYVDSINVQHGATTQCFSTTTPPARALEKKALEFDLHRLQARCKHLGTENNLRILTNIYEHIRANHDFRFRTAIRSTTVSLSGRDAASSRPSIPQAARMFKSDSRSLRARASSRSQSTTRRGRNCLACRSSRSIFRRAVRASTRTPSRAQTSRVCRPMEPVEPRSEMDGTIDHILRDLLILIV